MALLQKSPTIAKEFFNQGIESYIKAVFNSEDTHSYFQLGSFLNSFKDNLEEVEKCYLLSLKADPCHWDTLYSYADLLNKKGETELANAFYERASKIDSPKKLMQCTSCGKSGHLEEHCDKLYKLYRYGKKLQS
jgi:tetratricopeptide (TPR) repeat protein